MKISIFLFLFFPYLTFSQTFFLNDFENKSIVPYSHIKFKNTGGTYSDDNGCFTVDSLYSVQIFHINYRDTSLILNAAFPDIYLRRKKYTLEEVVVVPEDKQTHKWPTKKGKGNNYFLDVPSYEIGTIVTNYLPGTYLINTVSFPVKIGIDTPVLKVNIYELDSAKRYPDNIIDSQLIDVGDIRRNKLSAYFYPKSIELTKNQSLFIAIELVIYKQKNSEFFVNYENWGDPLRIKVRKRQDKKGNCFIRMKNNSLTWYPSSFFWKDLLSDYEPSLNIEFIKAR